MRLPERTSGLRRSDYGRRSAPCATGRKCEEPRSVIAAECTALVRLRLLAVLVTLALALLAAVPASADAHGPIAPVASSYLARISHVPSGLEANVVDGDLRMWLRVPPRETVVVLDYRGAPYLRFSPSGVWVNQRSSMYYLNQTPIAQTPPANLGPHTPPHWQLVSSGHDYNWHDGRLHALAAVARSPGASYVGAWKLPLLVDGRLSPISGGLWYRPGPSIVWFWPIVVLLLCVVAAWRVKRPEVDRLGSNALALMALGAIAAATLGNQLHGRPGISALDWVELSLLLAFVGWGLVRVLRRRAGYFTYFMIALVAILEGAQLVPTLLDGYVLMAVPAFVGRAASVIGLGAGIGLIVMVPRLFDQREELESQGVDGREGEDDSALELA